MIGRSKGAWVNKPLIDFEPSDAAESYHDTQRTESIGEIGQLLETLKAYNSVTKPHCSKSGTIGFLAKFSSRSTP